MDTLTVLLLALGVVPICMARRLLTRAQSQLGRQHWVTVSIGTGAAVMLLAWVVFAMACTRTPPAVPGPSAWIAFAVYAGLAGFVIHALRLPATSAALLKLFRADPTEMIEKEL